MEEFPKYEKKVKKSPYYFKKWFMGAFIIFIMVTSLFAFFGDNSTEESEFNGYTFYSLNQGWFTYVNNKQVSFQYLPDELMNITAPAYVNVDGQKVYLLYDPNSKNISTEYSKQRIATFLFEKNILPVNACVTEENCPDSLPIKKCEGLDVPAILFKEGPISKIYKQSRCYVIEADSSTDLYKATEKFIYQYLGVIQ